MEPKAGILVHTKNTINDTKFIQSVYLYVGLATETLKLTHYWEV